MSNSPVNLSVPLIEATPDASASPFSPIGPMEASPLLEDAIGQISEVLWGNQKVVELIIAAVLARGHLLLEDVPGVGKTMVARAIAAVFGLDFSRIQFTADLLPGDVLGVEVLDANREGLHFRKGPIFSSMVLADEINRASPKTQSAMLEAMAEGQVTVGDHVYKLPNPFLVVATQNPVEHHGAYPLPESQLDRFMMHLTIGYPCEDVQRQLLNSPDLPQHNLDNLKPKVSASQLGGMRAAVGAVKLSESVADYLIQIVVGTRNHPDILLGCSPRGAISFSMAARARAYLSKRDYILPDDVQAMARCVLAHRLILSGTGGGRERSVARAVIDEIISRIPIPR